MSNTKTAPAGSHRSQQRRAQLFELAQSVALLPSTLVAPMKVLQLHRRNNSTMEQFGEAISADPSLVSKIIGLVNSAAFKPAQPVTRLSRALVMIGLKNLLPLVFGVSLGGIFSKLGLPTQERSSIWRASLLKAVVARECARGAAPDWAEEAFVAALLQDVALPVIYTSDRSAWPETIALLDLPDADARAARERVMYATDHAELGAAIARNLGLPELYCECIEHHHAPAGPTASGHAPLAAALRAASLLPHRLAVGAGNNLKPRLQAAVCAGAVPRPADVELMARISDAYLATLDQFADTDERSVVFKDFMQGLCAEVALCMESAIGEATTTIADLRTKGDHLEKRVGDLKQQVAQSDYDDLTRVFNRPGFMRRAVRFINLAREHGAVSAMGFVDLDDFKELNDQYGHQAGDRALTTVAQTLVEALKGDGIVGRLGGDEFCFLLFTRDGDAFAQATRHIEQTVCRVEIEVPGGRARVSASMGIVRLEDDGPLEDLDRFLRSADALMYGAKRAGKGRCATQTRAVA
jgi:diguanylate cyclase (GGDEF)-like protein